MDYENINEYDLIGGGKKKKPSKEPTMKELYTKAKNEYKNLIKLPSFDVFRKEGKKSLLNILDFDKSQKERIDYISDIGMKTLPKKYKVEKLNKSQLSDLLEYSDRWRPEKKRNLYTIDELRKIYDNYRNKVKIFIHVKYQIYKEIDSLERNLNEKEQKEEGIIDLKYIDRFKKDNNIEIIKVRPGNPNDKNFRFLHFDIIVDKSNDKEYERLVNIEILKRRGDSVISEDYIKKYKLLRYYVYDENGKRLSMKNLRMKSGSFYEYKYLGDQKMLHSENKNQCVINLITYIFQNDESNRKVSKNDMKIETIRSKFLEINPNCVKEGISTEDIIQYSKNNPQLGLSIYAIDPYNQLFEKYIPEHPYRSFVYMVNDDHCYLINDKEMKDKIIKSPLHKLKSMSFIPSVSKDNFDVYDIKELGYDQVLEIIYNGTDKDNIIIKGTSNLTTIIKQLVEKYGYYITEMSVNNGIIDAFKNPVTNQTIILNEDIYECLEVSDIILKKTKNYEYKNINQNLASLSKNYFKTCHQFPVKSTYNNHTKIYMDSYKHIALCQTSSYIEEDDGDDMMIEKDEGEKYSLDINFSYSSVLKDNIYPYPIYDIFCNFQEYDISDCLDYKHDEEKFSGITLNEEIDIEKLRIIVENFDELKEKIGLITDKKTFKKQTKEGTYKILKDTLIHHELTNKIKYYYVNKERIGRVFANYSLQSMKKNIRHTISNDIYYDIDIENAHPNILTWYCNIFNIPCEYIEYYNDNVKTCREELMKILNISKDDAKKILLSIINDSKDLSEEIYESTKNLTWFHKFIEQMNSIHESICELNKELYNSTIKKYGENCYNPKGKTVNKIFCMYENIILMKMLDFCNKNNKQVGCLVFDGMMIKKENFDSYDELKLFMREMSNYLYEEMGIKLNITEKPMEDIIDLSKYKVKNTIFYEVVTKNFQGPMNKDVVKIVNNKELEGEYLINKYIYIEDIGITLYRKKYTAPLVDFLLKNGYIVYSDISKHMKPIECLKADYFKDFVIDVFRTFNYKIAKKIVNNLTGVMGRINNKFYEVCLTNSETVAVSLYFRYTMEKIDIEKLEEEGKNVNVKNKYQILMDKIQELYFVTIKKKDRLDYDNLGIYNYIIDSGIVKVLDLALQIYNKGGKVNYIKTDCVGYSSKNGEVDIKTYEKDNLNNEQIISIIGKYKKETYSKILKKDYDYYSRKEKLDFSNVKLDLFDKLYNGPGGCLKSTLLTEKYKKNPEKSICLTLSAIARDNLLARGCENSFDFDEYFINGANDISKYSHIFIDEYSMVPRKYFNKLYKIKNKNPKINIEFYGHNEQAQSIELGGKIRYDNKNVNFSCLFSEIIEMEYNPETGRYDNELFLEADSITKKGIFYKGLQETKDYTKFDTAICIKNETKRMFDKMLMNKILKETDPLKPRLEIEYNGKCTSKQSVILCENMKVICRENNKIFNEETDKYDKISNSMMFKVVDIVEDRIKLCYMYPFENKGFIWINKYNFNKYYELGFCNNVLRVQSLTIKNPFIILDVDDMTRENLYSAITRGTCYKNVYLDLHCKDYFEITYYSDKTKIIKGYDSIEGIIYKITNNKNNNVYVGYTLKNKNSIEEALDKRFRQHKEDSTIKNNLFHKSMKELGVDNFKIELIYCGFFENISKVRECEKYYINEYKENTYNTRGFEKEDEFKDVKIQEKIFIPKVINKKEPEVKKYEKDYVISYYDYKENKTKRKTFSHVKSDEKAKKKVEEFIMELKKK